MYTFCVCVLYLKDREGFKKERKTGEGNSKIKIANLNINYILNPIYDYEPKLKLKCHYRLLKALQSRDCHTMIEKKNLINDEYCFRLNFPFNSFAWLCVFVKKYKLSRSLKRKELKDERDRREDVRPNLTGFNMCPITRC